MMSESQFSIKLRMYRETIRYDKGKLSGTQLAQMLSIKSGQAIPQQRISQWETGVRIPTPEMVIHLVQLLVFHGGIEMYEQVEAWLQDYVNIPQYPLSSQSPLSFSLAEFNDWRVRKNSILAHLPMYADITLNHLVGIDTPAQQGRNALQTAKMVIGIEGMGGVGKTSLALFLARELALMGVFDAIYFVGVHQRYVDIDGIHLRPTQQNPNVPHYEALLEDLGRQMGLTFPNNATAHEKLLHIANYFHKNRVLVVLDNLETYDDVREFHNFVHTLCAVAGPSRLIITSRYELTPYQPHVTQISLGELSADQAQALFINYECALANDEVQALHQVIGGNPLALRLLTSLFKRLGVRQMLVYLEQKAAAVPINDRRRVLFGYLYERILALLDQSVVDVFLTIGTNYDVEKGVPFQILSDELSADYAELVDILEKLCQVHLLTFDQSRALYTMHRLTAYYVYKQFFDAPTG